MLIQLITVLSLYCFSSTAFTQEQKSIPLINKVWHFSLGGGTLNTISEDDNSELSKNGTAIALNTKFSFLTEQVNFDFHLGWMRTILEIDQTEQTDILVEAGSEEDVPSGIKTSEIVTRLGTAGVSARFRLGRWFEIGPTVSILFGSDASLSPDPDAVGDDSNIFAGANIAFLLKNPTPKSLFSSRLYAEFLTDLSVDERKIEIITFGLDFGFGLYVNKPKIVVEERTKVKYKTRVKYRTKIKRKTKIVTKVKVKEHYLVDAGFINFETDSYSVNNQQRNYLLQLAQLLKSKINFWEHVIIESHTDKRGSVSHNRVLSSNRANAVSRIFKSHGISIGRLIIRSNASRVPVARGQSGIDLAKNRRVEIMIRGPQSTNQLKQKIVILQQKFRMPSTCRGSDCS